MWMALILSCGIDDVDASSCFFNYSTQLMESEAVCHATIEHDAKLGTFRVVDPLTGYVQDYTTHYCVEWDIDPAT